MLDESIFVCYSTKNYHRLAEVFRRSLAQVRVQDRQVRHLVEDPEGDWEGGGGFLSDIWYYSCKRKVEWALEVLSDRSSLKGYRYLIFCDADICFLQNNIEQWDALKRWVDHARAGIFFMREGASADVNAGLYIVKNHRSELIRASAFLTRVLTEMQQIQDSGQLIEDQPIINRLKKCLRFDYIPNDYVVFGERVYNPFMALWHHAVCCSGVDGKIRQIELVKALF